MYLDEERGNPGILLAWDTSTERGTIAAARGRTVLAEGYFEVRKGHTGWLMPTIDRTCRSLGLEPASIDLLAAGSGPGTYTGVKVGVATAKALSLALGIPALGVSTLDVIAAGAPGEADAVVSTLDAKRGALYAAAYRTGGPAPERITDYLCLPTGEIAAVIERLEPASVSLVGQRHAQLAGMMRDSGIEILCEEERFPRGGDMIALVRDYGGMTIERGSAIEPIYLKGPI